MQLMEIGSGLKNETKPRACERSRRETVAVSTADAKEGLLQRRRVSVICFVVVVNSSELIVALVNNGVRIIRKKGIIGRGAIIGVG